MMVVIEVPEELVTGIVLVNAYSRGADRAYDMHVDPVEDQSRALEDSYSTSVAGDEEITISMPLVSSKVDMLVPGTTSKSVEAESCGLWSFLCLICRP